MTKKEEVMIFLARTTFRGTHEPHFTNAKHEASKMINEDSFEGWVEEAKRILWSLTPDEGLFGYQLLQQLKRMD